MLYTAGLTWNGKKGVEGAYQQVNRMGRSTLGGFQSIPLRIVALENGFTPARALLDNRQAGFVRRLHTRLQDGGGAEEVLSRERSALTTRLRAASALRPGDSVEPQRWGAGRLFPGRIIVEKEPGPWSRHTSGGSATPFGRTARAGTAGRWEWPASGSHRWLARTLFPPGHEQGGH